MEVDSWQVCGAECNKLATCNYFTYTASKKRCSMKAKVVERKEIDGKVSGSRGCPGKGPEFFILFINYLLNLGFFFI